MVAFVILKFVIFMKVNKTALSFMISEFRDFLTKSFKTLLYKYSLYFLTKKRERKKIRKEFHLLLQQQQK